MVYNERMLEAWKVRVQLFYRFTTRLYTHQLTRLQTIHSSQPTNMMFTTVFSTVLLFAAATFASVQAAPTLQARGVDPSLVPDFGVVAGTGPDGHG